LNILEYLVMRGRMAQGAVDRIIERHVEERHERCTHCGAPLPKDLGAWIVTITAADTLAIVCSQECALGKDFPP